MVRHIGTRFIKEELPTMYKPLRALLQATLIRLSVLRNPTRFSELLRTVLRITILASSPWKLSIVASRSMWVIGNCVFSPRLILLGFRTSRSMRVCLSFSLNHKEHVPRSRTANSASCPLYGVNMAISRRSYSPVLMRWRTSPITISISNKFEYELAAADCESGFSSGWMWSNHQMRSAIPATAGWRLVDSWFWKKEERSGLDQHCSTFSYL